MVFVTGATGFLGSYLVKNLLKKGQPVRALKRKNSGFKLLGDYANQVEWVEGDVLDIPSLESALIGVDKIYNCASAMLSSKSAQAIAVNAEGAANVFNVALDKGVRKVVHVSSTTALGLPLHNQVIDENYYTPADKLKFNYFKSKRQGELEAWRAQAEGLEVVIVNPGGLFGAGFWNSEPLNCITSVYEGLNFYTTGANAFMDVRDAAEAMVYLMDSDINGERFILISENMSIRNLLNLIADELQMKRPQYEVTGLMSELAWRFEAMKSFVLNKPPRFSKENLEVARIAFSYSNAKVLKATGLNFRSVQRSIKETIPVFLESKKAGLAYGVFD